LRLSPRQGPHALGLIGGKTANFTTKTQRSQRLITARIQGNRVHVAKAGFSLRVMAGQTRP
jgi:hypothetical protein